MLHDGTDTTARCLFLITFSLNDCFQSEYFQCSGGSGTSDSIDNFLGADSYPAITDKWQQLLRLNLTELPPSTGPLSTLDWWRRGGVWSYGWGPLVSSGVLWCVHLPRWHWLHWLVSGPSVMGAGTAASRSHSVALWSPVTVRSIFQVWAKMPANKDLRSGVVSVLGLSSCPTLPPSSCITDVGVGGLAGGPGRAVLGKVSDWAPPGGEGGWWRRWHERREEEPLAVSPQYLSSSHVSTQDTTGGSQHHTQY